MFCLSQLSAARSGLQSLLGDHKTTTASASDSKPAGEKTSLLSLSAFSVAARYAEWMVVWEMLACLLAGCLTSQQHASVSQGRICSDKFTCCHTEIEVAGQTFYLTQSQYTDTGPTSPRADPMTPDAWQGSHWSANFEVTRITGNALKGPASHIFGIFLVINSAVIIALLF